MIIDYEPPKIIEIIDEIIVYKDYGISGAGILRLPITATDIDNELTGGIYEEPEPEPEPDPEEGE